MKNTKKNFKELGKDLKGIGVSVFGAAASLVSTVVDTVKIPVSLCKDIRDIMISNKDKKVEVETKAEVEVTEVVETVEVVETPKKVSKPRVKKEVVSNASGSTES